MHLFVVLVNNNAWILFDTLFWSTSEFTITIPELNIRQQTKISNKMHRTYILTTMVEIFCVYKTKLSGKDADFVPVTLVG